MMWKTKSGRLVDIKDMSSEHLHNAIRMLERLNRGAASRKWIQILSLELKRRERLELEVQKQNWVAKNGVWAEECNDACI